MGADISRARFDALHDYVGVDLQQGRVLLDADFNELVDVLDRRLRAAAADLGSPGPSAGQTGVAVVPRTTPHGFQVTAAGGKLTIGVGRMYVDGVVVENHGLTDAQGAALSGAALGYDALLGEVAGATPTPYDAQPYWPTPPALPGSGTYLAYLDVWQRELTPLQEPDLVEVALGIDTTTRMQNVWQVRLLDAAGDGLGGDVNCPTPDADVPGWSAVITPSAGRLTTSTVAGEPATDPCVLPPAGGYRGLENQLYRVQIQDAGPLGKATFTWSRDNGSVCSAVSAVISPTVLQVASLGRDNVLRISTGDWVEFLDDRRELNQSSGELRKVVVDEAARTLTYDPALPADLLPSGADTAATWHLRAVRWDQTGTVLRADGSVLVDLDAAGSTGAIPVPADGAQVVLESGVAVSFDAAVTGGSLRAGDHWTFAARTADAAIDLLEAAPPRGIHHHYARLGFVTLPGGQSDCRTLWPPSGGGTPVEDDCECTICVTPESHASGAMTVQAAVDVVAKVGGTVCLEAGLYRLGQPVRVADAASVRIHGQGLRTVLVGEQGAFDLRACVNCTVEDLTVLDAGSVAALSLQITAAVALQRLVVVSLQKDDNPTGGVAGIGGGTAFALSGLNALLSIRDNIVVGQIGITGGRGVGSRASETADAGRSEQAINSDPVLAIRLAVRDNLFVCQQVGIDLLVDVVLAFDTVIANNAVWGGRSWGIGATGTVLGGGSMHITGNQLSVSGTAVIAGTAASEISGNSVIINGSMRSKSVASSALSTSAAATSAGLDGAVSFGGSAIVLRPTNPVPQIGWAAIEANAVTGAAGAGVAGLGRMAFARIERNVLRECGSGVVSMLVGADVSVCGNQILDLVSADGDTTGIEVVGAASLGVLDNVVDGLDPDATSGAARVGVRAVSCADVLVSRNQLTRLTAGGDSSPALGVAVLGSFRSATVAHNLVRLVPGTAGKDAAEFDSFGTAVRIADDVKSWTSTAAGAADRAFLVPTSDRSRAVLLTGADGLVLTTGLGPPTVTVDANTLVGAMAGPAVQVQVQGPVVISANHVQADGQDGPVMTLRGTSVIVSGNDVRGGKPSVDVDASDAASVVGNITSGGIDVGGAALSPPWAALNPVA